MAASPAAKARYGRPPSPPSDGDMPDGLQQFFQASPTGTAPSSRPISPPESPVNRKGSRRSSGKHSKTSMAPEGETATSGSSSRDQQPNGSPQKVKSKLAFPMIISDDDDWSPLVGGAPDDPASWSTRAGANRSGAAGSGAPRRTWSQTTTTTTHKTEQRSYRYSLPGFDQLQDGFETAGSSHAHPLFGAAPSTPSPRTSHGRPSRSSSSRYSSPSPSQFRPRSPSTTSAPRRRPSSPASSRSPRTSQTSRKPSHLHQSFSESPSHHYSRALSPRPSSPSEFGNYSLTTTTHNLFKPFMTLIAFLTISTIACFSVSAVLLASFSLTFYDDCGRRVVDVQRSIGEGRRRFRGSIEGVKVGMERIAGGARGALDLAVWAAAARMPQVRAAPTIILSDPEEDSEEEEWESSPSATRPSSPKPSRTRPFQRRRRSTIGSATGTRRSTTAVFDRSSSSAASPPFDPANSRPDRERQPSNTWTDDEDAMPYVVPHTTPWGSPPASPPPPLHRRSSPSPSPRSDTMPPRPPLRILIPSIFLALLYTLVKVLWALWRGDKTTGPRSSARGRSASR